MSGVSISFEVELPILNGHPRFVEAVFIPRRDDQGRVLGFFSMVLDVSETRKVEEMLRLQRHELAHVQRASTMGELTAALAHEICQPLTAIRSNA